MDMRVIRPALTLPPAFERGAPVDAVNPEVIEMRE